MREAAFIKQNYARWQEFERLLKHREAEPDKLADLFIRITDDLSFATTQYPDSKTTHYLNSLASQIHLEIYKNKKENRSRLITFWKYELPLVMAEARKPVLYSLTIFIISGLLGAISAANDDTFVRLILGDGYVNMTLENIEKGEPMGVYQSMEQTDMFFAITLNNIWVSFLAFSFGTILSVGTGFVLFRNGVMLGAFQYFFYEKGLFLESFLTIWIHGTLEISAIIIAGGAGLVMGNSILFPGTYRRLDSFRIGAKKGLKMVIGLIPIFIMAGFLESFVTRLTHMPWFIKAMIIALSAVFIVYYFFIYPLKLQRHVPTENSTQEAT